MKRLKTFASLVVAVFFLFAPPGTLIFIAVLIGGWFGWQSAVAGVAACVCALGISMLARARHGRKRRGAAAGHTDEKPRS
jgi:threonine/homoserine/homoserine lactone efflux protein